MQEPSNSDSLRDRFRACLLAGAAGDALGAPVEFMKRTEILERFGSQGITRYAPAYGGLGKITDDTQMTLFTAEGLLRGWVRGRFKGITTYPAVTANAYLRWLQTQGETSTAMVGASEMGWLHGHQELHSRRAPGNTCLSALRSTTRLGEAAVNHSKGCGGVMRMAPVGLFFKKLNQQNSAVDAFNLGTELSALTHGHPTGALPGGVLATLIFLLLGDTTLPDALDVAKTILREKPAHEETLSALELAQELAASNQPHHECIARLGQGWIAEEALAISVYCALVGSNLEHAVILAVNHDGDSDSTGAIVGNLLGAVQGTQAIPSAWLDTLELKDVITEIADDLHDFKDWDIGEYSRNASENQRILQKYPGS